MLVRQIVLEAGNIDDGVWVKHDLHGLLPRDLLLLVLEPAIEETQEVGCVRAIESNPPLLEPDTFRVGA
eukprot:942797-Karenia_brevis.AAC.1